MIACLAFCLGAPFTACSLYRANPIPPMEGFTRAAALDPVRVRVDAAALRHPLLSPIEVDVSDGLSPDEAAVLAVLLNPDLRSARDQRGEAEAQLVKAGMLPNPAFSGSIIWPYGKGSAGLTTITSLTGSMDTREILTRSTRRRAARSELASVDLGIAWQEWKVAESARLEAVRLAWIRRRLALAKEAQLEEEKWLGRLESGLESGDVTYQDVGVQRAAAAAARRTAIDLEQMALDEQSALFALLGQDLDAPITIEEPPPPSAKPPSEKTLLKICFSRRLDLKALRLGYEAQEARLRQAILEQFPNISVGPAYERNESKIKFFGGMLGVGVPAFDRNQGAVALEKATRARLRHEYEARVAAARADIERLVALVKLVDTRLPEVSDSIEPLTVIEKGEREAAARGDIAWLSYQSVRSALIDLKLDAAKLAQLRAETLIGLETACGGPLVEAPRTETQP